MNHWIKCMAIWHIVYLGQAIQFWFKGRLWFTNDSVPKGSSFLFLDYITNNFDIFSLVYKEIFGKIQVSDTGSLDSCNIFLLVGNNKR